MDLGDLRALETEELESLYLKAGVGAVPRGVYRGTVLTWFPVPAGEHPLLRPLLRLGFEFSPFGVDFDRRRWFFASAKAPRLGRFALTEGPSKWRDTRTLRLEYERSRLPRFIRSHLYDELKPLSEDLCLGIGGINAGPGRGEQFFFALHR